MTRTRTKKQFYAVVKGKTLSDRGVYDNWLSVSPVVTGVSGANHQGFETLREAVRFMRQSGIPDPLVLPRDENGVVHPMSIMDYLESDYNKDKLSVHCISPPKQLKPVSVPIQQVSDSHDSIIVTSQVSNASHDASVYSSPLGSVVMKDLMDETLRSDSTSKVETTSKVDDIIEPPSTPPWTSTPYAAGVKACQISHIQSTSDSYSDLSASLFSAVDTLNKTMLHVTSKLDKVLQNSQCTGDLVNKDETVIESQERKDSMALREQIASLERSKKMLEARHKSKLKQQLNSYEEKIQKLLWENDQLKKNLKKDKLADSKNVPTMRIGASVEFQEKFPSFYHMDTVLDDVSDARSAEVQEAPPEVPNTAVAAEVPIVPPNIPEANGKTSEKTQPNIASTQTEDAGLRYVDNPDRPPIYFKHEMPKAKKRFAVLSNLYPHEVYYNGYPNPTNDHALHDTKMVFLKQKTRANRILREPDSFKVKEISKEVPSPPEWESQEAAVLEDLNTLKAKSFPKFKDVLLSTRGHELRENTPDKRWGYSNGKGFNEMGRLLMRLRDNLDLEERLEAQQHVLVKQTPLVPSNSSKSEDPPLNCGSCNSPINPGTKFCEECGHCTANNATSPPKCEKCNGAYALTAKFCRWCGHRFAPPPGSTSGNNTETNTQTDSIGSHTGHDAVPQTDLNVNAESFVPERGFTVVPSASPSKHPTHTKAVVLGDLQAHRVHPHITGIVVSTIPLSGYKLSDIKDMVPYVIDDTVTDAFLIGGTNDVLDSTEQEFSEDYLSLVTELVKYSPIYLCGDVLQV